MIYIFSIDKPNKIATKKEYFNVLARLKECGYKVNRAEGCWQGTKEKSIIAEINQKDNIETPRWLAWGFNQDAILIINNENKAFLDHLDGSKPYLIGVWHKFKSKPKSGDYTKDIDNNTFYQVI